ncbi:lysosomal dipeptide transporter MFSD1-like, partial [Glossina fuscipes fuscipes]
YRHHYLFSYFACRTIRPLAVAQKNYTVLWFKGKGLNMGFGLQLSVARLGSIVNSCVMQSTYDYVKQFRSAMCSVYTNFLNTLLSTKRNYLQTYQLRLAESNLCASVVVPKIKGSWKEGGQTAAYIAYSLLRLNSSGEIAKLSDITTFKITFWMVSIICLAYYVSIFPFIALGKDFSMEKFKSLLEEANNVNSILYLISAVASPLFGFIIDKTAHNMDWIFLATSSTTGAHSLLTFTMLNPYVIMVIVGLSYSVQASSLWSFVTLIVPEYQLGTVSAW